MPQSLYEQFREAVLKVASPEHKAEILIVECNCGGWKYKKQTECEKCGGNNGFVARNITLEDVLRVIKEKRKNDYGIFTVLPDGVIKEETDYESWLTITTWNLTKPAHQQSDETLLSIINLLK